MKVYDEFDELDLTFTEMGVLSLYKYMTERGTDGCCYMSNENIAKKFHTSLRSVNNINKKLRGMGLITIKQTVRNSRVTYVGRY